MQIEPALAPTFMIQDHQAREQARRELFSAGGRAHRTFSAVEQALEKSTTKYYISDDIGLADLDIFTVRLQQPVPACHFVLTRLQPCL